MKNYNMIFLQEGNNNIFNTNVDEDQLKAIMKQINKYRFIGMISFLGDPSFYINLKKVISIQVKEIKVKTEPAHADMPKNKYLPWEIAATRIREIKRKIYE